MYIAARVLEVSGSAAERFMFAAYPVYKKFAEDLMAADRVDIIELAFAIEHSMYIARTTAVAWETRLLASRRLPACLAGVAQRDIQWL